MNINQAIRHLRERLGFSQQIFATDQGISMSGLANYERDRIPPVELLTKLALVARRTGLPDLETFFTDAVRKRLTARLDDNETRAFEDFCCQLAGRHISDRSPEKRQVALTPHEVAKYTGFGVSATYKLLREGSMPSVRVGSRFFVPRSALDRWLESCGTIK